MIIKWHNRLTVDGGAIDADQKRAIALINQFLKARNDGKTSKQLYPRVQSLLDCVSEHLVREEQYAVSIGFPGAEAHKKLHDSLREQIQGIVCRLKQSDRDQTDLVCDETTAFLKSWMLDHILKHDREFNEYRRRTGTKGEIVFL